jgi:eukaryotic-like serine/threonine-protein kinase
MSTYCVQCDTYFVIEDGTCTKCDGANGPRAEGEFYLSGHKKEKHSFIELPEGERLLDRFTVKLPVGRGFLGTVYLAHDALRSADVALKILKVGLQNPNRVEQLRREVHIETQIKDRRYIIETHDIHFAPRGGGGLLFISMEYADGGSFRKWLIKNPDTRTRRQQGMELFLQSCRGIKAIHEYNMVHADIKPENILLVDGCAKVADFNASRYYAEIYNDNLIACSGTPHYASPEQLSPHPETGVGPLSDLYGLAVVLVRAVGRQPAL